MEQSTARLRKTFHYPAEDDSEPEALDEEGQSCSTNFILPRLPIHIDTDTSLPTRTGISHNPPQN
jgi:hypothetical protein